MSMTAMRQNWPMTRLPEARLELTLSHGDRHRSLALRPFAFYAVVGLVPFFGLAFLGASLHFIFNHEALASLVSRQSVQQRAYEDRVETLRLEIARLASARALDQAAYGAQIRALSLRQARIERRARTIAALADRVGRGRTTARRTVVAEAKPPAAGERPSLSRTSSGNALDTLLAIPGGRPLASPAAVSAFLPNAPAIWSDAPLALPTAEVKPQPQATELRSDPSGSTSWQPSQTAAPSPVAEVAPHEPRLGAISGSLDRTRSTQMNGVGAFGRVGQQTVMALRGTAAPIETDRLKPANSKADGAASGRTALLGPAARKTLHGRALLELPSGGTSPQPSGEAAPAPIDSRFSALSKSLDKIESTQMNDVAVLGSAAQEKAAKVRRALAETGLETDRLKLPANAEADSGIGGPYIPLKPDAVKSPFERAVFELQAKLFDTERLERLLPYLPLRQPFSGPLQVTSPFGPRIDPFFGRLALHPGIDLRQAFGSPVFATAAGNVTIAGPDGGYGNLVEIDHGNGLVTRYGHLSSILVREGETVAAGQVIGKVGSTGRSTGPHLHYEVRIDGEPVDPMRFLEAGMKLATSQ